MKRVEVQKVTRLPGCVVVIVQRGGKRNYLHRDTLDDECFNPHARGHVLSFRSEIQAREHVGWTAKLDELKRQGEILDWKVEKTTIEAVRS